MAIIDLAYLRDPATQQILFDAQGYPLMDATANAGANTYGAMQLRIQDEVLGSPTIAQIQNAIQDAIQTFEMQDFWFNAMRTFGDLSGSASDLQTVNGQEFYSNVDLPVLINMPHISKIMVLAFANRYALISRTSEWIDDQSISTSWQGLPTDWCWQAGALRIYPVPNGGYPLILDGTIRFRPMVQDSDYSVWTNRGEMLIRQEAKRLLFTNITRNPSQAAAMMEEVYGNPGAGKQGALNLVRRETTRRSAGPIKMRASRGYF